MEALPNHPTTTIPFFFCANEIKSLTIQEQCRLCLSTDRRQSGPKTHKMRRCTTRRACGTTSSAWRQTMKNGEHKRLTRAANPLMKDVASLVHCPPVSMPTTTTWHRSLSTSWADLVSLSYLTLGCCPLASGQLCTHTWRP